LGRIAVEKILVILSLILELWLLVHKGTNPIHIPAVQKKAEINMLKGFVVSQLLE
jgi:hypothetical protein